MKIDIAQARKQAKELVKSGEAATLAEAQLRIARELGYASWPALVHAPAARASFRPAPGEWQAHIVVWEVDDAAKAGDSRYWWLADEVERLERFAGTRPVGSVPAVGTPKGRSLADLRSEFGGDEGVLLGGEPEPDTSEVGNGETAWLVALPKETLRLSLGRWSDANPETTYLTVAYVRGPSEEERALLERTELLPPEVDELRREWVAALDEEDEAEPLLRARYEEELKARGSFMHREVSAFDPRKAVELSPGVFVQDERPESA